MVTSEAITTRRGLQINKTVFRFDKSHLPLAPGFWEDQFGQLRWNRKGWAATRCIFHASKSGKSFSVHRDGGFFCFGCDARGGGLIDFVMLRDHCDFKTAAKVLGAWEEAGQPAPAPVMVPINYLVFDYVIDGVEYRAEVKDEPRYPGLIRRFYREASDRLIELSRGDAESYIGEQEDCWGRMACAVDELRELEITV